MCECGCGQKVLRRFVRGHNRWKGDQVGYSALHRWIRSHKEKTGVCQWCKHKGTTQFANLDGKYSRDVNDYIELCIPCHKYFDGVSHYVPARLEAARR